MKNDMKRIAIIFSCLLFISFVFSCTPVVSKNGSSSSTNPWVGNWYGKLRNSDTLYRLSFTQTRATLYYPGSTSYLPLYESANYEYTSKSFDVVFTRDSYGKVLDNEIEIYGTMIPNYDNKGFYLWNDTDMPFFDLDD